MTKLLAGFHLYTLDQRLSNRKGVRYLRFMDDLLILSQTRGQLQRAIKTMNQWFDKAGLKQHPNKTYIGRPSHGFDWLGYHFNAAGNVGCAVDYALEMLVFRRCKPNHPRLNQALGG